MSETKKPTCEKCEKSFAQNEGRGRPRKFCQNCRPSRAAKK